MDSKRFTKYVLIIVAIIVVAIVISRVQFKEEKCECNGCHLSFINGEDSEGDRNIIRCCYDTYVDNFGQCHRETQEAEFSITKYGDWV